MFSPVSAFGQFEGTAHDYYNTAGQVAETWHSDAELLYLAGTGEEMHLGGETFLWTYFFESASDDSILMVIISLGLPVLSEEIIDSISIFEPLPSNWIDSDEAVAVAEANGGSSWRETTGSNLIIGSAGRGLYLADISRPVWLIAYSDTTTQGNNLYIHVDAVTGEFIDSHGTDIGEGPEMTRDLPKKLLLSENFPNPFNPSTTLRYEIPAGEVRKVSIVIFDLRGREVKTLMEGRKEPGIYQVTWDGKDENGKQVGSGIYLARLRSGGEVEIRKMVLAK